MTATAISVKAGQPAPPNFDQTQCEELAQKNESARRGFINKLERKKKKQGSLSEADTDALNKAKDSGMTFSSASIQVGAGKGKSAVGQLTGCSSGKASECLPSSVVEGGSSEVKQGQPSRVRKSGAQKFDARKERAGTLCDGTYVHPGGGAGAHGEAKIINQLTDKVGKANLGGGSMLFKIDWRFDYLGKTYKSGMPCRHCFKMLCHAATECGIEIYLCDGNNQPKKLNEDDRCKDEEDDAIASLDQAMGEHALKGLGRA
jgi:hypothetical protein